MSRERQFVASGIIRGGVHHLFSVTGMAPVIAFSLNA